ncbi:MAG: hypothetical protein QXG05_08180 [Nitrososphaerota archaeon]
MHLYKRSRGVANTVFAAVVVVLIVIAAVGFGLYISKLTTSTSSSSTTPVATPSDTVTALAYEHWAAIGQKNLSATLSQYGSNSVLYWYVKGSALNGTYTTASSISATWQAFFSHTTTVYYIVTDYSLVFSGTTSAKVTAIVWYLLGNGTVTLKLPYELDYAYTGGHWVLTGDWWGLPNNPGTITVGVVQPGVSSSSSSSSSGYGYGYG